MFLIQTPTVSSPFLSTQDETLQQGGVMQGRRLEEAIQMEASLEYAYSSTVLQGFIYTTSFIAGSVVIDLFLPIIFSII